MVVMARLRSRLNLGLVFCRIYSIVLVFWSQKPLKIKESSAILIISEKGKSDIKIRRKSFSGVAVGSYLAPDGLVCAGAEQPSGI